MKHLGGSLFLEIARNFLICFHTLSFLFLFYYHTAVKGYEKAGNGWGNQEDLMRDCMWKLTNQWCQVFNVYDLDSYMYYYDI